MAEPVAARNYKTICIYILGSLSTSSVSWNGPAEVSEGEWQCGAGELTEPASRVCFHPYGSQEVQETTSDFGSLILNMLKWKL